MIYSPISDVESLEHYKNDSMFLEHLEQIQSYNDAMKIKMVNKIHNNYKSINNKSLESYCMSMEEDSSTFNNFGRKILESLIKVLYVLWKIISFIPKKIIEFINRLIMKDSSRTDARKDRSELLSDIQLKTLKK